MGETYTDGQNPLLRYDPRFRRLSRARQVNKFGRNPDAALGSGELVWPSDLTYTPMSSADTIDVYSDSANDNPASTGVHEIIIQGLDADFNEQEETIILNGLTPVTSAGTYRRLHRMYASDGFNIVAGPPPPGGNISAEATVAGTLQSIIPAQRGQTLEAKYTVPAGMTAFMTQWYGAIVRQTAARYAEFFLWSNDAGDDDDLWRVRHSMGVTSTGTGSYQHVFDPPWAIPEKTDLFVGVEASANDTAVHAGFDLYLVDN